MEVTGRLLLVSNRLPMTAKVDRGHLAVSQSTGGLVTGLRRAHEHMGGSWIGWPGDVSRMKEKHRRELEEMLQAGGCVPVHLTSEEVSLYYDGFANGVLWPLFHQMVDRIPVPSLQWDAYRSVNEKFAEAVVRAWQPGDIIWVHDYHLTLVPGMVRARIREATIGFFLHIPFPSPEIVCTLPWCDQVLQGMLGANLVGFHTFTHQSHFASCAQRVLGASTSKYDRVRVDGRKVRLGVFPIGVDAQTFGALASDPAVLDEATSIREDAHHESILLGVDRLDYTKGILARLLAFERFLEREPQWRGKVRVVQLAVPSRDKVPRYRLLQRQLNELVGRINGSFSTVDWVPIHYMRRSLNERQVAALYRAADVMLVTPFRDGMNLVAKEFVACRSDHDGVLVLSEFAGAAVEMGEALQVNPYDIETMARTYAEALTMPGEERRVRMESLRHRVFAHDVHLWTTMFVEELALASRKETRPEDAMSPAVELDALTLRLRAAKRLLLLLDYDGTLVPFARTPDVAAPDTELRQLLAKLAARPGVSVHVVSGRRRGVLERWLGDLHLGLHAEHGYWWRNRPNEPWRAVPDVNVDWKPDVKRILDETAASTPGTLVEEKTASMAWHWRRAEPELGAARMESLSRRLDDELRGSSAEIVFGKKMIEVRSRGVSKAGVLARLQAQGIVTAATAVVAMGDDRTDEECFAALPAEGVAIGVGFRATAARYRVATPRAARALLATIANTKRT